MKSLIRNTFINALSLFFLTQIISGVKVSGGVLTFIIGGLALSILLIIVKPILNLLTLPLNMITLGLFSVITNVIIFYLLTVFVPEISISAFTFNGFSFAGFIIPKITFGTFFAFAIISVIQSLFATFISWTFSK